ncbi:MAG: FAD-dependent thymidylate synthase [Promethearchaeota archaeon]
MVQYVDESFEILTPLDGQAILKQVELAGRTCYKSEDKISGDSYLSFARMIMSRQHFSVIEHYSITVRIISNRGLSHELVRHRTASYAQESTRYCNYSKGKFGGEITVIDQKLLFKDEESYSTWKKAIESSEKYYMQLLAQGIPSQVARGVLPIDLKTEIIITANLREWRHIFELRTSQAAHPNIRRIMKGILDKVREHIPIIFDDI